MAKRHVTLFNKTDELLYLRVEVKGKFQEWSLPPESSQTINPKRTDVVLIQTEPTPNES